MGKMMSRPIRIANPYGYSRATLAAAAFWQNPNQDSSAIQRWQREQIEHSQYDIKNQSVPQVVRQPSRSGDGQIANKVECQRRKHREDDIHGGSGSSN